MLTVLTTEPFSRWFSSLPDPDAEEVAVGLELIEQLGPDRDPPDSRDLLLWYQARSGDAQLDAIVGSHFPELAAKLRPVLTQLLRGLEACRPRELAPKDAQCAAEALQRIRRRVRGPWLDQASAERQLREIQRDQQIVLDAFGIRATRRQPAGPALRELNFCTRKPGMRVLYGVDAPQRRALVVLGERLDRVAYGPSVRRALATWHEFLANGADAQRLALRSLR